MTPAQDATTRGPEWGSALWRPRAVLTEVAEHPGDLRKNRSQPQLLAVDKSDTSHDKRTLSGRPALTGRAEPALRLPRRPLPRFLFQPRLQAQKGDPDNTRGPVGQCRGPPQTTSRVTARAGVSDTRLPRISAEQSAEAESGGGLPPTCSLLVRVPPLPPTPSGAPLQQITPRKTQVVLSLFCPHTTKRQDSQEGYLCAGAKNLLFRSTRTYTCPCRKERPNCLA